MQVCVRRPAFWRALCDARRHRRSARLSCQHEAKAGRSHHPAGVDHARRFRDIAAAIAKLSARTLVLDGEVAIFDEQLRSRFDWLRESDRAAVASPPVYMAFDLLYRDGRDLSVRPLAHRRVRLEGVVAGSELVFPVRRLAADGLAAWKQVVERGHEGYVAKDDASPYEGGATRRWLKVKQKDWTIGDDRWTRRISVAR
jgi:bifunctional non-homologous end joining protein LigD